MAQIQAKPKNLFSWGFDLYESGNFVLTMDMSWLREGGHFEGGGLQYTLSRESVWSGDFLLQGQRPNARFGYQAQRVDAKVYRSF